MRNKTGLQAAGDNTFSVMCERGIYAKLMSLSIYAWHAIHSDSTCTKPVAV